MHQWHFVILEKFSNFIIETFFSRSQNGDQRNATRIVIARGERFATMESVRKNASMTKIVDQMT